MAADLLDQITDLLSDSEKSVAALGTLFATIRLSVDQRAFDEIKRVVPRVESWMGLALAGGGGRTGEMLALVGPKAVERNLRALGLDDDQMSRIATAVGTALHLSVSRPVFEQVTSKVPFLKS